MKAVQVGEFTVESFFTNYGYYVRVLNPITGEIFYEAYGFNYQAEALAEGIVVAFELVAPKGMVA